MASASAREALDAGVRSRDLVSGPVGQGGFLSSAPRSTQTLLSCLGSSLDTLLPLFPSDSEHQPQAVPAGSAEWLVAGERHGLLLPEDGVGCRQRLCSLQVSGLVKVLETAGLS